MSNATVRDKIALLNRRIARLKRVDRTATSVIVLGGVGIVASVLGILIFILAESWPMFRASGLKPTGGLALDHVPLAFGTDEYRMYLYTLEAGAQLRFKRMGESGTASIVKLEGLASSTVTAGSRSIAGDFVAAATSDGRVALVQVRFRPRYEGQRLADLEQEVRARETIRLDPLGRPIRAVSYDEIEARRIVVGILDQGEVVLWSREEGGAETRTSLPLRPGERATLARVSPREAVIVGTESGRVYHWELQPEIRLTDVSPVSMRPITALEWLLGGATFIAGDAAGEVSAWFRARPREDIDDLAMLRAHRYTGHSAAVRAIAVSSRDRSFATLANDGTVHMTYATNERLLCSLTLDRSGPIAAIIAPRSDALFVLSGDGKLDQFEIDNPHPEASVKALFARLWYEGYSGARYVWQSTGLGNDFEPKTSLIPLIFGTIKGTLYAMVFAVPIAVLGALYTSQFVHPAIKAKIKPTVEIMAAVPSVVIGFIAGLWLSPLVEKHLVGVFLMIVFLPLSGTLGVILWRFLPSAARRRLKPGTEIVLIMPLVVAGGFLALALGPVVEGAFFSPDFRLWLAEHAGMTYDQRNCLVVGLALGVAVIPIIFTISEDAFSSVPSSLTAGSLALGASRWQTALNVVLPTASPGVFSAVMVGFGRAVGETMIVLMATGNTPLMDWSIFNGMRTLSANIAVEIPEAPYGGTLYRVLFLSGAALFFMTFAVNTLAEIIRQRLRDRYRAL